MSVSDWPARSSSPSAWAGPLLLLASSRLELCSNPQTPLCLSVGSPVNSAPRRPLAFSLAPLASPCCRCRPAAPAQRLLAHAGQPPNWKGSYSATRPAAELASIAPSHTTTAHALLQQEERREREREWMETCSAAHPRAARTAPSPNYRRPRRSKPNHHLNPRPPPPPPPPPLRFRPLPAPNTPKP
jgi:hypothetical protein